MASSVGSENARGAVPSTGMLDRPAAWGAVALCGLLLALAGLAVPWDWVPGGALPGVGVGQVFTAAEIARAEAYSGFARLWGNAAFVLSLATTLILGLTRWGSRLAGVVARRLSGRRTRRLALPATVFLLVAAGELVSWPLALVLRQRRLEEGLTEQGLAAWLQDRALSLLVSWVVAALLVWSMTACARRWPRRWFLPVGGGVAVMVFAGSLLYPLAVEPLFNRFTPLADGRLKASVLELAEREGVDVGEVLVADASRRTTTFNAYVSGWGGTRRVVLYDTLVDGAPPDQVRAVVAHELAHAGHRDVLLGTALGALGAAGGVGVLALLLDSGRLRRRAAVRWAGDPAAAALILALLAAGQLATSPVQNTVSRAIEARADRTALSTTAEYDAFRSMQRTLALRSLADPTPPRALHVWFGSHPTVLQRFGIARAVEQAAPGSAADGAAR